MFLQVAQHVQHFTDGLHGLGQVLLHRHIYYLLNEWEKFGLQVAQDVQHLADGNHGLGQILSNNVLHNINTSKIESEKFQIYRLGAVTAHLKRGGIIARPHSARKVLN